MAINPSYDFNLFDVPTFSPLYANELGASTSFSANDPAPYVDFSLGQLIGTIQPNNSLPYPQTQFPAVMSPYPTQPFFSTTPPQSPYPLEPIGPSAATLAAQAAADKARQVWLAALGQYNAAHPGGWIFMPGSNATPAAGAIGATMPGAGGAGDNAPSPTLTDMAKKFFANLPAGAGLFLMGIAILILIFLFARKQRNG